MFHNILVALDGSPRSLVALEQAADLARSEHAHLALITVNETPWTHGVPESSLVRIFSDQAELAKQILGEAVAAVPRAARCQRVTGWGSPARVIIDQVETGGHDLVVLGSRGRGPLSSALLGSVGRDVLTHSPVPVMVVRGDATARPRAMAEERALAGSHR